MNPEHPKVRRVSNPLQCQLWDLSVKPLVPIEGNEPSLPKEHLFERCASSFRHIGTTLVAPVGIEPTCPKALVPKTSASTFRHGATTLVRRPRLELGCLSTAPVSHAGVSSNLTIDAQLNMSKIWRSGGESNSRIFRVAAERFTVLATGPNYSKLSNSSFLVRGRGLEPLNTNS